MEPRAYTVLCTCPDGDTAARLARGLVEGGHAACVNVLPGIRSIYRWQGEVQDDAEVLLLAKCAPEGFDGLRGWLEANHPYDVPEVIALPVTAGSETYLDWLGQQGQEKQ